MTSPAMAILLLSLTATAAVNDPPSAKELRKAVLKQRQRIQSGRIEMTMTNSRPTDNSGESPDRTVRMTIEFEPGHFRLSTRPSGYGFLGRELAKWEDRFITQLRPSGEKPRVVRLMNFTETDPRSYDAARERVIDPRVLGVITEPADGLQSEKLEAALLRSDEKWAKVVPDRLDGRDVWRIDSESLKGSKRSYWIAPELGYSMLQIKIHNSWATCVVTVEPRNYDGIWYPGRLTREVIVGEDVIRKHVAVIEDAAFNIDIDDERFGLKSFDLRPGTTVIMENGRIGEWDGDAEKIVKIEGHPLTRQMVVDRQSKRAGEVPTRGQGQTRNYRHWLIANAVIFAVICGLALRRHFHSRSSADNST